VTLTPAEHPSLYTRFGLRLLYWRRLGDNPKDWKGPREKGWNDPNRVYPLDLYDPTTMNVGVFTGHEIAPGRFLHDVDLDWWAPGVRVLVKNLLPSTDFGFRRQGKGLSHAFYTAPTRLDIVTYYDLTDDTDGNGQTLVELRGGDSTHQTMIAPSLHSPGVYVELVRADAIGHLEDLRILECKVLDYGIGCLLLKRLPGGLHHEGRLALAGFLLRHGFEPERASRLLEAICDA
jgi:hypothetical protein